MTIIKLENDLVYQVAEIEKECFASPVSESDLKIQLSNPASVFFAAVENGKVIGYIGSNIIIDEAYIQNVAVSKKYRKQGVGSALINALIDECKKRNVGFLTLEVRQSNIPAIRLYEKAGFVKVGERKDYYSNPSENALLYTLFFGGDKE